MIRHQQRAGQPTRKPFSGVRGHARHRLSSDCQKTRRELAANPELDVLRPSTSDAIGRVLVHKNEAIVGATLLLALAAFARRPFPCGRADARPVANVTAEIDDYDYRCRDHRRRESRLPRATDTRANAWC
jgi:hypothetical protein